MTEMVTDLHTSVFSLFVVCPNGADERHKIGDKDVIHKDKYIPNSRSTSPLAIQMFEFVGKLMGHSLRTKATLPFNFPSFVWKGVVGQPIEDSDLSAIDLHTSEYLKTVGDPMLTEADFEAKIADVGVDMTFTTTSSNGKEVVELLPGGATMKLSFQNRRRYEALVRNFRLHELDRQLAAIRRGLSCVVPLRILQLFTWTQVEELVAGKPDVDLEELKRHTEYRSYTPSSPVIKWFWEALESLTQPERTNFIRFVWGRSRLPLKGRPWPQTFKIQRCPGGDSVLPQTHTCFFSIEVPEYSSAAITKKRIHTAITYGTAGILNG
jgi:hypothetical protein